MTVDEVNEASELGSLLRAAAHEQPVPVDLDRVLAIGRRRVRARAVASSAGGLAATAMLIVGLFTVTDLADERGSRERLASLPVTTAEETYRLTVDRDASDLDSGAICLRLTPGDSQTCWLSPTMDVPLMQVVELDADADAYVVGTVAGGDSVTFERRDGSTETVPLEAVEGSGSWRFALLVQSATEPRVRFTVNGGPGATSRGAGTATMTPG